MPNWCDNTVTLRHSDKSRVDALAAVLENKEDRCVFNHLRPNPKGEWEYDWSVANWGTKWDISVIDWERRDDNEIWISFESAWSPPTVLYEYIVEQGWVVDAIYYEPGMGYGGVFNGDGDDYYEFDLGDPESIERLPEDLIEFGDLRTRSEEYVLEELDSLWADADRTEWYPTTTAPVYKGIYEIHVKGYEDRKYVQFCKYDADSGWDFWNKENILEWRGLTENHSA